MLFKNTRLKQKINLSLTDNVEMSLMEYQIPIGRVFSVRQLAWWIDEKSNSGTGSVIEELEVLVTEMVKHEINNKYFLSTHEDLIKNNLMPYFNTDLGQTFSRSNYLKKLTSKRLVAVILDKILNDYYDLANLNSADLLSFIGKKPKVKFKHVDKQKGYYKNKVLLNEILDFARKLDLMFDNSQLEIRVVFKNHYDQNNQFIEMNDSWFKYDLKLSFFDNFRSMTENSDEIIRTLENDKIKLFSDNNLVDSYELNNLKIDFDKIDTTFIPVMSNEALEGYKCAIYTNNHWDNYRIGLMSIEKDSFINSEEQAEILNEINNSLVVV